jgi:pimeloyl-ACP methyl ester carboxylesterase
MQPRRHTFPAKNTLGAAGTHELVFYDFGDVNATRNVICVHGLTRNAHDFDILAEALANQGCRVFSLNMAGRGESAWLADPMGYNYASYVADCLAIMDNFHLRGVEWIGTSMGGIIGMMIAASTRDRIKKLVLNDIGIVLDREALSRIYTYVRSMPTQFASRAEADDYLATTFKPFGITDPALWQRFVESSLLSSADGTLRLACDPAIAAPLAAATNNYTEINDINLTDLWEQVDVPTLIIRGAESDILSDDTVRAMRRKNTRAESITIAGVGHAPALMTPDQITRLTQWLSGTSNAMLAAGM